MCTKAHLVEYVVEYCVMLSLKVYCLLVRTLWVERFMI